MDGYDLDVDLAVLQSMYDAQGYDPQTDYSLDDFRTDVYEFLDEFSTFLYGSFGFDGDGEPAPCGNGLGGDDEPCGTPPGPNDEPIEDIIIVYGTQITALDVAAWSYTNAASLIYGYGWSVTLGGGGSGDINGDTPEEDDETAEHNCLFGDPPEGFVSWAEYTNFLNSLATGHGDGESGASSQAFWRDAIRDMQGCSDVH